MYECGACDRDLNVDSTTYCEACVGVLCAEVERLTGELAAAKARIKAMRPYLQHNDRCARRYKDNCSCGLREALRDVGPEKPDAD